MEKGKQMKNKILFESVSMPIIDRVAGSLVEHCLSLYGETEEFAELAILVGYKRGLELIHQSHHWQTSGVNFYGDHLLFEKLLAPDEIDKIGEKVVGLGNVKLTNYFKQLRHMYTFVKVINEGKFGFVEESFNAELVFIACIKDVMERLEEQNLLTTGVEQLLGDIVDTHEGFLYLLKNRIGSTNNENDLGDSSSEIPVKQQSE